MKFGMKFALIAATLSLFALSAQAEKAAPVTQPPQILERADPVYTEEARKARVEGKVVLYGLIGVNGRVGDIRIAEPLGYGLGDAAIDCVRKWRFKPATKDGVAVPARATLEVRFRLPPR